MCQYFSHDYNARFDIKLRRLQFDMGLYGLGAYWGIVEELYNCGNALRVSDIKMVARSLSTTAKKLMRVITDYDLFSIVEDEEEGDYICSKSVARRLELRRDASKQRERSEEVTDEKSQISEMRRAAANARWKSKTQGDDNQDVNANAMQNDANAYANGMQNGDFAYAKPMQVHMQNSEFAYAKSMQNDAHINIKEKYKEKDKLTTTTSSSSTNTRKEIVDVDVAAAAKEWPDVAEMVKAMAGVEDAEERKAMYAALKGAIATRKRFAEREEEKTAAKAPQAAPETEVKGEDGAQIPSKTQSKGAKTDKNSRLDNLSTEDKRGEINAIITQNVVTPTALSPEKPAARTVEALTEELSQAIDDSTLGYQLLKKSNGMKAERMHEYLPEFAGQLAMEGKTNETGVKLILHFGYWLAIKQRKEQENQRHGDTKEQKQERFERMQQHADDLMSGRAKIFG